MLAQIFAIVVVALAVLGPGYFLWRWARERGGIPRKLAAITLVIAMSLVAWLMFAPDSGSTNEERISQFIGAWGILFMAVGIVVVLSEVVKMIWSRRRSPPHESGVDDQKD